MAEEQNQTSSYRSIFKATSLFGSLQAYQILIGVAMSKIVAVCLGPVGMGIQGLYQSALQLISSISSCGLAQSAVRNVSEAHGSGDKQRIGLTVAVVKKLVWITGLLGLILTIILSPILSKYTFGNYDFTIPFILLSVILLFNQLSAGQNVVLQGMRMLKHLAKASAIGSTVGLLYTIPLYYFLEIDGIIPTMILGSLLSLIITYYYSKKIDIEKKEVTNRYAIQQGKSMLKMGLAISMSAIMVNFTSYLLRGFIRYENGTEHVGLFTSGFMFVNSYVGMVFTAMATDYYPRLSAVNQDNEKCRQTINQQGEIATLIMAPILVSCLILMPFIIRIIYTEDFLPATDYIMWAVLGMMFKTISWVIAYYFLAKAESKLFIINETIANIYSLVFSIIGYHFYGLAGAGMAFVLTYILYSIQVYLIAKKRYGFSVDASFKKIYIILFLIIGTTFVLILVWKSNYVYIPTVLLFVLCLAYSLMELNRRMNFRELLRRK